MSATAWTRAQAQPRRQQVPEARYMLCVAPLGAIVVGAFDLASSGGVTSDGMLGFVLVALFYLLQVGLTLRSPGWVETWWSPAVAVCATLATALFSIFLVAPRPGVAWFWLVGMVGMLAGYLCQPRRAVVVWCLVTVLSVLLMGPVERPLASSLGLVSCAVVANLLPATAASVGLGRIRRRERAVLQTTRLDPVTEVLNRRGLEHELREWSLEPDAQQSVAVISITLDGFEEAVAAWGGAVSDQVLARVGAGLGKAHHRSHLVSRFVDHEFVVVSDVEPELLVPSLLRAVRMASPQRPVTASAGVVAGVPLDLLVSGQLVPMVERARQMVTRAQVSVDATATETFDPEGYQPIGVPAPVTTPPPPVEHGRLPWSPAEWRVLGWWLAASGLLLSALPRVAPWDLQHSAMAAAACLVLAGGGVWLAQHPHPDVRVAQALVLLLVPTSVGVVAGSGSTDVRAMAMQLVTFPVLMAGTLLSPKFTRTMAVLLPLQTAAAALMGPEPARDGLALALATVVFAGAAAVLAVHIRLESGAALATLHALSQTDPTTGVLTREGLSRDYLELPPSNRSGVLLARVLPRGEGPTLSLENDLVLVATSLHELARGRGLVGRVSTRDLAMVIPTADRLALLRRRLDADLEDNAPDVRVVVGIAHTDHHTESGLWEALAEADLSVRHQLTGRQTDSHLVPADPVG
ncbi:diguanylate cyclase domain-containing protein [Arsenicicoccus dermatophilus]|uniref:diguanylate cyclase domain-containing protein n=1 Tax=Arsenicicoccus dermatophilus TaxID=1076331 RepID=UPI001F4CBA31|nr:diguanylate cyclase [Arsenicicoccus dermatophilus]MCH8613825.1 GGDEF domain-containing protein [Arsenicicoccus dermatophilus]